MGDAQIGLLTSFSCFCFVGLVFFDLDNFFISPTFVVLLDLFLGGSVIVVWN